MKKTFLSIATVLLMAGSGIMVSSCDLGTVGSTLANGAVNSLLSGNTSASSIASSALTSILSGDSNTQSTLGTIANSLLSSFMNKGTSFTYSGSSAIEALSGTYEPMAYNSIGKGTPTLAVGLTTNQATVAKSTTAALTIPAYTVASGITTSELTIANLGVTTSGSTSTIALTDNSGFSGSPTCTVNGKSYEAKTCYITSCTVNGSTLKLEITVYYGSQYTNPINISYTGTLQ